MLAHNLQVGANDFNLNGWGPVAIMSHFYPASFIGKGYTSYYTNGPVIDLMYNGTVWLDLCQ
jgi:hypothetical protein